MTETERDVAFCAHTIAQDKTLVVPDTQEDPRFKSNPFVVGHPHIRFYAGVRLMIEGFAVGTLCVSDNNPNIQLRSNTAIRAACKTCRVGTTATRIQ
jgi:GAF domain-containing protein